MFTAGLCAHCLRGQRETKFDKGGRGKRFSPLRLPLNRWMLTRAACRVPLPLRRIMFSPTSPPHPACRSLADANDTSFVLQLGERRAGASSAKPAVGSSREMARHNVASCPRGRLRRWVAHFPKELRVSNSCSCYVQMSVTSMTYDFLLLETICNHSPVSSKE